jgi:small-conductance mechanosensitive channel
VIDWIVKQTQQILSGLSHLFTTHLFVIGDKHLSLSTIVALIFFALGAFIVSRFLSEWIKRRLLVRMGMSRGSREAVAAVTHYLLTALGFLIVLQTAGINLSSLTVLAGVLGIGLGFGLQNLASNFISGLTLLVEQPIKVGDFIEVDKLSGTVEKISIRSTIVRTIDGVFVIVPNIRFVENNIINWSYQDPKCCIHIPAGVAYGTDPVLVTEALLAAARTEAGVLSNPSPRVWFKSFGESSLNFELLAWIEEPENSDPIKSALHFRIEHEFRYRGIEIPFPQRELNIRNPEVLGAWFHKDGSGEGSNGKIPPHKTTLPESKKPAATPPNNWTLRDLLRRVTYFESCTDLELRRLIEYGYRQLFPMGQIVCEENDLGDSFYIILTGSVEVFSQQAEKYIATLHAGEFFGEMSLLLGTPRSATVRTLEDSILFVVCHNDLQQLLVDHQELADEIAQKLSERQQALRNLGLLDEGFSEETPFIRIRKQIQTLFGI